eukprot:5590125-Prymnesium_polylepis.1
MCTSPKHQEGPAVVEVTNNMQQYSTSGIVFRFESVTLLSVHPRNGPVRGGSKVDIKLERATPPSRSTLFCHFGSNGT